MSRTENVNTEKLSLLQVAVSKLWEWLKLLAACVVLIAVFYIGTRVSLEWSQKYFPLALHVVLIAFWAFVALLWVRGITGEFGKSMFIQSYVNGILWPPFVYSISLLVIAAAVFASISVTLQRYGLVKFEPALPNDLSPVVDFYVWHFVNAVPGLGIPQTLRWTQPYDYSDHLSGALLLAFKIAVIVPVIASFKLWHDVRKIAVAEKKWSALKIGMSPKEVADLLGKPDEEQVTNNADSAGNPKPVSIWHYTYDKEGPGRTLIFDGIVTDAETKGTLIDWTKRKQGISDT